MRNDITYGVRNHEILESAMGFFMMELLVYSYTLGVSSSTEFGVIFFFITILLISFSRILAYIIFIIFTIQTTKYLFHRLEDYYDTNMLYIFTAIGFIFILRIHNNAFYYYHEPEYEYDED